MPDLLVAGGGVAGMAAAARAAAGGATVVVVEKGERLLVNQEGRRFTCEKWGDEVSNLALFGPRAADAALRTVETSATHAGS